MLHWVGPGPPQQQQVAGSPPARIGVAPGPYLSGPLQQGYPPNMMGPPGSMLVRSQDPRLAHTSISQLGHQQTLTHASSSTVIQAPPSVSPQRLMELRKHVEMAEEEARRLQEHAFDMHRLHEVLEHEVKETRLQTAKYKEDVAEMRKGDEYLAEMDAKLQAGRVKEKELSLVAAKFAEGVPPPLSAFESPPIEAQPWVDKAALMEFDIERTKQQLEAAIATKAQLQRSDREDRRRLVSLRKQIQVLEEVYERIDTHLQDCQAPDGSFDPEGVVVSLAHLFVPMVEFHNVSEAVAALQAIARGGQPALVPSQDNSFFVQHPPSMPASNPSTSRPLIPGGGAAEVQMPLARSSSAPSFQNLSSRHPMQRVDSHYSEAAFSNQTVPNTPSHGLHSEPDAESKLVSDGHGNKIVTIDAQRTASRSPGALVPPVKLQKSPKSSSRGKSFMPTKDPSSFGERQPLGERQVVLGSQLPALLPTETKFDVTGVQQQLLPSWNSNNREEIPVREGPLPMPPRSSDTQRREPLSYPPGAHQRID